ncbi:hypothetical protein EXIGLDRAFT_609880 [Exidia glandulosa HHB12029]|uniref:UbiA prenyltransferase n=1 Tax=Exidia glandulosa HHB12029 TaxID=1314781 RepID=A0A165K7X0_EXIGL|nr:hypothetical protein EXIGLDRAFT_609880 [Exidia glandulosa HHB12029]
MLPKLGYHAYTLFLFTYSDYKTIFVPVGIFALAAAPTASTSRIIIAVTWLWLQQLQTNVTNQYLGVEEDAVNKPWRPIPSGRISRSQAITLRWILPGLCTIGSGLIRRALLEASVAFAFATLAYNEMDLSHHWLGKNVCCGLGYMILEAGTTLALGDGRVLADDATRAIAVSGLVIASTIQVQDFPDIQGDMLRGRRTLPIVLPQASCVVTSIILAVWSLALGFIWNLNAIVYLAFSACGLWTAYRTFKGGDTVYRKTTYRIYNIWLMFLHILPIMSRLGSHS